MNPSNRPDLGVGVGLRSRHYGHVLAERPAVDWFECISENFMVAGGEHLFYLDAIADLYPVVLHGVSMNIGGVDPLDRAYLRHLSDLAARVRSPWISDHLCWTGARGVHLHDLLPLPMTAQTVRHVADRIRHVQDTLGRPFAVENISSYMTYRSDEMPEWEFLSAVVEAARCHLLLDVNNIFVSAHNHGFDPRVYLDSIPHDRVIQMHLAGPTDLGKFLLDSHGAPVRDEVWALYRRACERVGPCSTLIEWDNDIPPFERLQAEADQARRLRQQSPRGASPPTTRSARGDLGAQDMQGTQGGALHELQLALPALLRRDEPIPDAPDLAMLAGVVASGSARMSPAEQLEIYRDQFFVRHIEGLLDDYAGTCGVLGAERFEALARAYLVAHPPASFTLRDVGDRFPGFLERAGAGALAVDMARLEWALVEASDAEELPPLAPSLLTQLGPDDLDRSVFLLDPGLGLLELRYPVHELLDAAEVGELPGEPGPRTCWVVVYRKADYTLHMREVSSTIFRALGLLRSGVALADALDQVAASLGSEAELEAMMASVGVWFAEWMAWGWLRGLAPPGGEA